MTVNNKEATATMLPPETEIVIVDAEEYLPSDGSTPQEVRTTTTPGGKKNGRHGSAFDCSLCGNVKVRGRQVRPGNNTFISLCGSIRIDLSESELPPNAHVRFTMIMLCGDFHIKVPKGTEVTVRQVNLCGNRNIDIDEAAIGVSSPRVRVTVVMLVGKVRVIN